MEIHCDEVHSKKYQAKGKTARKRPGEYKVFNSVAQAHRRKQCWRAELPEGLKAVLRRPDDEDDIDRPEQARKVIAACVLGERICEVETEDDAAELVHALHRNMGEYADALNGHELYRGGSRLLVEEVQDVPGKLSFEDHRRLICDSVLASAGSRFTVRTRPLSMKPPLDSFANAILDPLMTIERLMKVNKFDAATKEKVLDKLHLALYDALFLNRCIIGLHRGSPICIARRRCLSRDISCEAWTWARSDLLMGCALTARLSSTALPQAPAPESLGRQWTGTRCGYKQTPAALTHTRSHLAFYGIRRISLRRRRDPQMPACCIIA